MNALVLWASRIPLAPLCLIVLGATLWPEMELLVPSLPGMKLFFNVSEGEIQQLLSINFIGFFCGVLLVGPLCDSLGRKVVCLAGAALFLLASLGAALSDNFTVLMVMRFMQGITVTAPIIASGAMLLECVSVERQIGWMSISSAIITLCMAGAPLLGAFINAHFGFQGNLWAIFLAVLIGIMPVAFFVKETLPPQKRIPVNPQAIISSYWALLKNGRFMGMIIVISCLPAAFWVYSGVSSLYLVDYLKLDPALFGSYQGPIVGAFALLSLSIGFIHRLLGLKNCLIVGFIMMAFGAGSLLILAVLGIEDALLMTILMMFFVGGMVPVNALLFPSAINLVPSELKGSAQSLIQALRLAFASIGTLILGFVYQGPFLPVAIIISVMALFSWALLWHLRHRLDTSAVQGFAPSH